MPLGAFDTASASFLDRFASFLITFLPSPAPPSASCPTGMSSLCFFGRVAAGEDGDEALLLPLEDDTESGDIDLRARLSDGVVAER